MTDPPEVILKKFPNPVTLDASRAKYFLLATALFGATNLLIGMFPRILPSDRTTFLIGIFFCAGAFIIFVFQLLPGASMLKLDKDGFELTTFYRRRHVRWQDVSDFTVWTYKLNSLVTFNMRTKPTVLSWLNKILAGRNGALPDTYGLSADTLANLLSEWRKRALQDGNLAGTVP